MKKLSVIITIVLLLIIATVVIVLINRKEYKWTTDQDTTYMVPRVLFITTGAESGNGQLAEGVIIALQTFNGNGAYVQLASRNVLWDPDQLAKFNIIILHSSIGYHDADRKYSLTYMSDAELLNIQNWVKKGGVLISGDNVGRNTLESIDRVSIHGKLTPENWVLSQCFGVSLEERNLKGFLLEGKINENLKGTFIGEYNEDHWTLVADSMFGKKQKILAWYKKGKQKIPAMIENKVENGMCFMIPTSYLLHPSNEGGYWSSKDISSFYEYVLKEFFQRYYHKITMSPWPDGNDFAFCVTLNAAGEKEQYKKIFKILDKNDIEPTFFVDGQVPQDIQSYLLDKKVNLQSNAFRKINFRELSFPQSMNYIKQNESIWKRKFSGFRFPFTRNSAWGLIFLEQNGYYFDSSIGADNINSFYGCVFPYNLPVSKDDYYKVLNVLEISPTFHDDYFFYKDLLNASSYSSTKMLMDAELFNKYLHNYLEYAVKPYHGAMVFLGHPLFTAYSDTTIKPLISIINTIKEENAWITSVEKIADYWNNIGKVIYKINDGENDTEIFVCSESNIEIKDATILLFTKPRSVKLQKGKHKIIEGDNCYYLVFDAFNGQKIRIKY